MATIYDVAKRANVSVATVSAVINNSSYVSPPLRQNVEAAIAELHYHPNLLARSLAKQKTQTIGMLIPDVANPFFPEVVRGAEDRAQKAGYTVILGNSDNQRDKEEVYLNLFLAKRVDGILLIKSPGEMSVSLLEKLTDGKTPIVLVDRHYPPLKADLVLADDVGGSYEAVKHLLRLGHRRIGVITGMRGVSTTEGRLAGYRKALQSRSIRYDPSLVIQGDYRMDSGFEGGILVLKQKPTAVFVTNFLMTVGFMKALEQKKLRCPQDVAVISYDDFPWLDSFYPRLTSVEQPKYLLGYQGAQLLLDRIGEKHKRAKTLILKNNLRIRESCGFHLKHRRR